MASDKAPSGKMKKAVLSVEKSIIMVLIGLMAILLILATVELIYTVYKAVAETGEDTLVINLDNLMNVFGVFLLVVIGIELLDTIRVYFREHVIHVEVVMLVAVIAIARKIIVMDFEYYSGLEILGIAAIMLALAGGYFLIKKAGGCGFWTGEDPEPNDADFKELPTGSSRPGGQKRIRARGSNRQGTARGTGSEAPRERSGPRSSSSTGKQKGLDS